MTAETCSKQIPKDIWQKSKNTWRLKKKKRKKKKKAVLPRGLGLYVTHFRNPFN